MIRNLALLLTLGLFLAASSANACDGDKANCKGKAHKTAMKDCTDAKCMKNGKCTMTKAEMAKAGCCAHDGKTTAAAAKAGCDAKAGGKHACCKGKAETKS